MKVLSELEFSDSLNDNSGELIFFLIQAMIETIDILFLIQDAVSLSSNNSNEICNDSVESQQQQASPSPNLDATITNATDVVDTIDNIDNFLITTEINESGKFL